MQERPPPEVTVRDPARPDRPMDLLVSGEEEPRTHPFSKRRLQALGGVLLVAGAALLVAEVRERRAAAAEERRLARVLDLDVEIEGSGGSYEITSGVADLELQLALVNDGPRDVVVERATAGSYVLTQDLVEVPAGGQAPLLLRRSVTCSPTRPPAAVPVDGLRLELRTAAGPRATTLPLDPGLLSEEAARACGFVPLAEAVDIRLLGVSRPAGGLEVALDLSSRSIDPVSLAALEAGPGLRTTIVVTDGASAVLPLRLPADLRDGTRRGVSLEVRVTVVDCAAARTAQPALELQITDDQGRVSQPSVGYDPAFLGSLLSSACPT